MKNQPDRKKPGRPPKSETAGDRREALLDAAELLFAAQGITGTSIRQVAEQSGSNPALVHYYFGNKQALVLAVMERVLEPMAEAMPTVSQMPGHALENVVRLFMQTMQKHPALPQLVTREVLLPGGELQQYFIEHYASRLGGALPGMISGLQQQNKVNPQADPALLALTLLALCAFPFIAKPLAEQVLKVDYSAAGQERMIRHTVAILEKGALL